MPAECHTSFQTGCQCVLCRQTLHAIYVMCRCLIVWKHTQIRAESTTILCVCLCGCSRACVYTSEHKPYPERDKSNPLPGGAQGSSIDGTLSGCWWTSLSDKVYHSDLSQSKTLSGISKHQGNLRPTFLLEGNWADSVHPKWKYAHSTFVFTNDFSPGSH